MSGQRFWQQLISSSHIHKNLFALLYTKRNESQRDRDDKTPDDDCVFGLDNRDTGRSGFEGRGRRQKYQPV